ncbi:hypothetical protein ONA23_03290 [Mycoplasmopsis cynos]|nr:hypothetical protein [Mycoplasmopsis cynos]WAM07265.1 hypothetical protein ONA23_03290 [Mycoplasmopsis cynos]
MTIILLIFGHFILTYKNLTDANGKDIKWDDFYKTNIVGEWID